MDLYNKYGVLDREYNNQMWEAEKKCFDLFLSSLPADVTLGETRVLFHEFQSGLYSTMCEHIMRKAMEIRKSERVNYEGIIINFEETQRIIDEVNKQVDINSNSIIERIKCVRRISDVRLVEAKNFVEKHWDKRLIGD